MPTETNLPIFRILDEESGVVMVSSEDVRGFFAKEEVRSANVTFLRVHELEQRKLATEQALLEIINHQQERIGEYHVGRLIREDAGIESRGTGLPSVTFTIYGGMSKYPMARNIWRRWASAVPLARYEWAKGQIDYHEAWLHVVQNSWFTSGRRATRYGANSTVYIDGREVTTRPGFYCALGEAVNGPGGYFGSNLDALADCLASEPGRTPTLKIVWRDFQSSTDSIGQDFVDLLLDVMREFHVEVVVQ